MSPFKSYLVAFFFFQNDNEVIKTFNMLPKMASFRGCPLMNRFGVRVRLMWVGAHPQANNSTSTRLDEHYY